MELTKEFSEDQYGFALQSWSFLDLTGLTPQFTSLFGDIFFEAPDRSWWYLDLTEGSLLPEWSTASEMVDELQTERGQDQYLLGGIATAAANAGLELGPTEVYDFILSPVMGGRVHVNNLLVTEFSIAASIAGQMHADLRRRLIESAPEADPASSDPHNL
jgi:hypothetical protein